MPPPPAWYLTILAWWNALPHWLVTLLVAFAGGAYNYLTTIPSEEWLAVLATPSSVWIILKGALLTGLAAVALLVKQSFLPNAPSVAQLRALKVAARTPPKD